MIEAAEADDRFERADCDLAVIGCQLQGSLAHGRGRGPRCDRPAGAGHLSGVLRPPSEVFLQGASSRRTRRRPLPCGHQPAFSGGSSCEPLCAHLGEQGPAVFAQKPAHLRRLGHPCAGSLAQVLPKSLLGEGLHYLLAQREPLRRASKKRRLSCRPTRLSARSARSKSERRTGCTWATRRRVPVWRTCSPWWKTAGSSGSIPKRT